MPTVKVQVPPRDAEALRAVVQVQMPVSPSDPEPNHALVFTKGRNLAALVPIDDELKAKMNGRREAYFEGERYWLWKLGKEVVKPGW